MMIELQNHPTLNPQLEIGKVTILEAAPLSRQVVLEQWLKTAQQQEAMTWLFSCNLDRDGIWAGLKDWLTVLIPHIQRQAPELIDKHSYELVMVLPSLRRQIVVQNPNLTDIAADDEQTRNYPIDRAYRIGSSLLSMLDR